MMDSNQRSYRNDESILVFETNSNSLKSESFDTLNVVYNKTIVEEKEKRGYYRRAFEKVQIERNVIERFYSLQSALTDGCDFVHLGDTISFSGMPHLQKEETVFILPLINHTETHNIIPETIYFHCISGVKNVTIGILSPLEENKVITVFCRSDVLIFHSTEEYVKVIKAKI